MVLASTLCNMGRQNNSEKKNWLFAIFYSDRSAPDNTPECGRGHIAGKISRENSLECRIDRIASTSLGKICRVRKGDETENLKRKDPKDASTRK